MRSTWSSDMKTGRTCSQADQDVQLRYWAQDRTARPETLRSRLAAFGSGLRRSGKTESMSAARTPFPGLRSLPSVGRARVAAMPDSYDSGIRSGRRGVQPSPLSFGAREALG